MQKRRSGGSSFSMPLVFLVAILLGFTSIVRAQNDTIPNTTDENSLKSALLQLETDSGYQFFFIEDWVSDKSISKQNFT